MGVWEGAEDRADEKLSCTDIYISFFCLSGPEDVTLRPSGAMTTWLLELTVTSFAAFNQKQV